MSLLIVRSHGCCEVGKENAMKRVEERGRKQHERPDDDMLQKDAPASKDIKIQQQYQQYQRESKNNTIKSGGPLPGSESLCQSGVHGKTFGVNHRHAHRTSRTSREIKVCTKGRSRDVFM